MTDENSPEKSPWGWKALIIACILGLLFMGFFWLAVSNEPDYMPSQQKKDNTQQHAFKNAPAMSQKQMTEAQQQKEAREAAQKPSAADMNMTEDEHAHMNEMQHETSPSHNH